MRWFVEISSIGKNQPSQAKLCVEAAQWQPALQAARALRGDHGALNNFSIELLDDGYRAIDPASRLRYVVRKAPDDAALTNGSGSSAALPGAPAATSAPPAGAAAAPLTVPSAEPAPEAGPEAGYRKGSVATLVLGTRGVSDAPPAGTAAGPSGRTSVAIPVDPVPPPAQAPGLPKFELLSKREDEPKAGAPLTYREAVYAVAAGTSEELASALLRDRFAEIQRTLSTRKPGKLVNLAVFDHAFRGKPQRPPIATLEWKDWKLREPELRYPLRERETGPRTTPSTQPAAPPERSAAEATAPAANVGSARAPAKEVDVERAPAAGVAAAPSASASARKPARDNGAKAKAPAETAPKTPKSRLAGDDLLAELFEAFSDLHFLRDSLEGADFVLATTLEKLPSEVGLVSLFDINKREFVVVRQTGGPASALLARIPEKAPIAQAAMRSHRAVVIADARADKRVADDRWRAIGIDPRSVVCAPVELGGRYLGLIELANPLDGGRFTDGDGHALTYIGQQFAEFVAARGVVIETEAGSEQSKGAPR